MDGIQGAVLNVKLKYLPAWTEARRKHAKQYNQLLEGMPGIVPPHEADYAQHVYHIYAIRTERRDELMTALGDKGIATGIHYPVPLHLTGAYRHLGCKEGSFPVSEQIARELVSLPMFPELNQAQIEYVVDRIKEYAYVFG